MSFYITHIYYNYVTHRFESANLASFIHMLEENKLLTFDVVGDTEEHFENRLKLQKYVYLARFFDLDMGYQYSMYLYGPYSPRLAEAYYNLGTNRAKYESMANALPKEFNYARFIDLVRGKDSRWLEIAATLLSLRRSFTDRRCLLERAVNMKGRFPRSLIKSVMAELESTALLTF